MGTGRVASKGRETAKVTNPDPLGPTTAAVNNGLVQAETFVTNALVHALLRTTIPRTGNDPSIAHRFDAIQKHLQAWNFSVYAPLQSLNSDLSQLALNFTDVMPTLFRLGHNPTAKDRKAFMRLIKALVAKVENKQKNMLHSQTQLTTFITALEYLLSKLEACTSSTSSLLDRSWLAHFNTAIQARRSYLRVIAGSASVFVLNRPIATFTKIDCGSQNSHHVVIPHYIVEAPSNSLPDMAQAKLCQKDYEISELLAKSHDHLPEEEQILCIIELLSDLKKQGTALQSALRLLDNSYTSIQVQLSPYASAESLKLGDRATIQTHLKKAYHFWNEAQSKTSIVKNQLVTLPFTELSEYSCLSGVRLAMSVSRASEECKRIAKLRYDGPVAMVSQNAASDSAERIVEIMDALNTTIQELMGAMRNAPDNVQDRQKYIDTVVKDSRAVESNTKDIAESLDSIARKWLPDLKELQKKVDDPNQDVPMLEARSLVGNLSASLDELSSLLRSSEAMALVLDESSVTASRELTSKAGDLDQQVSQLENSIKLLDEEITAMEREIKIYEDTIKATCWMIGLSCIAVKILLDNLVIKKGEKNRDIQDKKGKVQAQQKLRTETIIGRNWCNSTAVISSDCADLSNLMTTNVQVLRNETKSAANASNPDDLFELWLSSQLGIIIDALEELVLSKRSKNVMSVSDGTDSIASLMYGPSSRAGKSLALAAVPKNVPVLEDSMGIVAGEVIDMNTATSVIVAQPDLRLVLTPTVMQNQALLQSTGWHWKQDERMKLMKLNNACGMAGTFLVEFIRYMLEDKADPDTVVQGLIYCRSELQSLLDTVEDTHATVKNFIKFEVDKDVARFNTSRKEVEIEYNSEDGRLSEISAEMNVLQMQIDVFNSELAKGATGAVVKAWKSQIMFTISVVGGRITIPDPDGGSGKSELVLNWAEEYAVEAATDELGARAIQEMKEAVGGEAGLGAQEARISEMRSLIIERSKLVSALVSFATICEQLNSMVFAISQLDDVLNWMPYDIDEKISNMDSLIYFASGSNVDIEEVHKRLKKLEEEYDGFHLLSSNLEKTIIESVFTEDKGRSDHSM